MLRRTLLTILAAIPLSACLAPADDGRPASDEPLLAADFVGRWVEVLPGSDGPGFELREDGTAAAIDQPTLTYTHWRVADGKLFLTSPKVRSPTSTPTETGHFAKVDAQGTMRIVKDDEDWLQVFRRIN